MVITIGAHWSPLELEIEKEAKAELNQMVIFIGALWSPLELEIEKRDNAELILMVITIGVDSLIRFCWRPLKLVEFVELVEFVP